jgi:hypothetical protein
MYKRAEEGARPSSKPREMRKENRTTLDSISHDPGGRGVIFVCFVDGTGLVVSTAPLARFSAPDPLFGPAGGRSGPLFLAPSPPQRAKARVASQLPPSPSETKASLIAVSSDKAWAHHY